MLDPLSTVLCVAIFCGPNICSSYCTKEPNAKICSDHVAGAQQDMAFTHTLGQAGCQHTEAP